MRLLLTFIKPYKGLTAATVFALLLDVAGALPTISGSYAVREALEEAATMAAGGMSVEDALAACVETSNAAMQG